MKIGTTGLRWWHAGLFLAAFAVSLAVAFPARWAGAAVERATDGRVRVVAAPGRVIVAWGPGGTALRGADSASAIRRPG